MSLEANEAQREKSKFVMQTRRELETKEQTTFAKYKHREKKTTENEEETAGRD